MFRHVLGWVSLGAVLLFVVPAAAVLSPCSYDPVESASIELSFQGNGQWYNDPYLDDRNNLLYVTLLGDFSRFYQSPVFGYQADATGSLAWSPEHSNANTEVSGSAKYYLGDLPFAVGAAEASLVSTTAPTLDLTLGLGYGRFRDVTPLAQAIRIQNELLDVGLLLAPVEDDVLLHLAAVIGDAGLVVSDRLVSAEEILSGTGLLTDGTLGARGLLLVDQLLTSPGDPRLCGWDLQARVGVTVARFEPIRDALVFSGDYALVPDPVSQWRFGFRWSSGMSTLAVYEFETSITYLRRLGDQWRLRSGYTFTREAAVPAAESDHHRVWGSLLLQLTNRLHLRIDGEIRYGTGDEELTETLGINLEFDALG